MRKILFILIFCIRLIDIGFGKSIPRDRVAIVGNSLATQMSVVCQVDNIGDNYFLGNHSCAGDTIYSHGFYSDCPEINAKKGDYSNQIRSFTYQSGNYDIALLFFGSNELCMDSPKQFLIEYDKFIKNSLENNSEVKLLVCSIPYRDPGQYYIDTNIIDDWNYQLEQYCLNSKYKNNITFCPIGGLPLATDGVHISTYGYKHLWDIIKKNYRIGS